MDTAPAPAPRAPRITNACEACRAAKVKCQASTQLGICKRCLDSKRECIFKTGPRTRRPRQLKSPNPATTSTTTTTTSSSSSTTAPPRYPPPPGPSKTFTIDIPMPAEDDITDSLEALRLTHEKAIDMLVPNVSEGEEEEEEDNNYGYDDYGGDGRYGDYDQEMCDHDWLDQQEVTSTSVAGSVLSHASSLPLGASALSTPPSSVVGLGQSQSQSLGAQGQQQGGEGPKTKSRTLASLRLQPQFNLDSAGKLLETFRKVMLSHFHCVVVGEGDTVAGMAKERPFVLLAVLAAASGSRTLQGHSLYDEEFRKILGLKFVAGGERTLELLQGLVVYIAWYPFHLRPKNKQAVQYIRMIVDIISDLELDEDPGTDSMEVPPTPQRLDEIRLYLASYYLASSFASTWGRSSSLAYTEYTARCSDLLQHHSPLQGDRVLAWQARLQRLVEETNDLRRTQRGRSQSEYQIGLMIRGMETQLAEWEARMDMDPPIAANTSIRIGVLFTRVFLSGAPLLKLPSVRRLPLPALVDESSSSSASFCADPRRLMSVIPALHALYEYLLALDPAEVNSFIGIEWGALILGIILGFRMSFPLVVCPEWDDRAAREAVGFRGYVDRFCNMGGGGLNQSSNLTPASSSGAGPRSMDVLSASKVVLDMVRRKFLKRVVKLEGAQQRQQQQQQQMEAILAAAPHPVPMPMPTAGRRAAVPHDSAISGCPMMDGSMEPYYPYWDETFNSNLAGSAFVATGAQGGVEGAIGMDSGGVGLPNDLWTAMTMGWSQGDVDFDGL
ncbi:hypothetical protein C8A00DRAFT_13627 [Chaetomidium leptoderma]|uniref:Zn(2)-C6 fungal-type domain-containing protein n=1 Tax=Chaetomidium leptoderma TaxID=669021 RepID=A0AAN6VRY4_9PEZI|nr:hypothetical protein C8A00DRAFT_13627 [Chaetomidium leptoderma]